MCHSRFRGTLLWSAYLGLAAHGITCAEAQVPDPLPPVVVQPPRPKPAPRAAAATHPVPAARVRASKAARRSAPVRRAAAGAPAAPIAAAPATPGAANAAPSRPGYTAAPAGLNLDTPTNSGSRLGLTPFETPATVEVIPGQQIQDRGQHTIPEAITQNATGITTLGEPGNGFQSYTARGFAGNGSVMSLYDGTRTYVAAGTVTYPFDTWNVDRIEVLRGPASVLYGEGAIGGVVNVVPKKPTFVSVNELRVGLGSDGTKRLALDSGGAVSQDVAYRLNISGNQTDGWLHQNGDFRNLAISGALLWQVNPDFALTLSQDYGYNQPMAYFGSPTVDGRVPKEFRRTNFNVNDNQIAFSDNITQLKAEWNVTPDLTFRNTAYYINSERHWRDAEYYSYDPMTRLVNRGDYIEIYHDLRQYGNRFDATHKGDIFGMKNTFLVGFDVNHIDYKVTSNSPYLGESTVNPYLFYPGLFLHDSPTVPGYKTSTDQASVFAEDRLQVTDQFALVGGLRYEAPTMKRADLVNPLNGFTSNFEALTYRVGAVYNPVKDTALYVQYATGVDPIGNLVTASRVQADYRLATGRQIEGGVKQKLFGDRAEITLTGYHIVKDNLLSNDPLHPTVQVQVGSQSSTGFEAAASVKLLDTLRLDGNVALLRAQYEDFTQPGENGLVSYKGKRPINVPNQVANLWATWAFWPRWQARVGVQYVGAVYNDYANSSKRPDYMLLNASIDYRITDRSRLSLRGYNLTDKVYATSGSTDQLFLGRPRTVEVAYSVNF